MVIFLLKFLLLTSVVPHARSKIKSLSLCSKGLLFQVVNVNIAEYFQFLYRVQTYELDRITNCEAGTEIT